MLPTHYYVTYHNTAIERHWGFTLHDDDGAQVYVRQKLYKTMIAAVGAASSKLRHWKA